MFCVWVDVMGVGSLFRSLLIKLFVPKKELQNLRTLASKMDPPGHTSPEKLSLKERRMEKILDSAWRKRITSPSARQAYAVKRYAAKFGATDSISARFKKLRLKK